MGHFRLSRLAWPLLGLLSMVCAAVPAAAQQPPAVPPGPLTLEQVLDLAEARSEAIAVARAGVGRARGEQVRARSELFPQLSATASYDRALASEFEGIFDGGGGAACAPFALNPQASIDARVSEIERAVDCGAVGGFFGSSSGNATDGAGGDDALGDLPFGRENTWRFTLSFSQSVWSGGRIGAQQAVASAGRQGAELGVTTARAQFLFEVTQAYYDAALSDRLVGIAEATLEQAGATLKQTQAGFDAGTQPEFEVLRARVSRDNQTPQLIRQRVNRDVALLRLKQLLDLPIAYTLRLTDALGDDLLAPPPVFAAQLTGAEAALKSAGASPAGLPADAPLPERIAVAEAATVVSLREASLRLARAQAMPSVAINSAYSRVGYPTDALPTFDRTNWSVGASVTVPILNGGRLLAGRMVAQADLDQSRAQLQQVTELAALDTRAAWAELLAARAVWEASAGTVQQASRAYDIADVRYRSGVSTQLELSDARLLLQQADANRAQAARDLQVARARIALLPNLPLSTGTAGGPRQQPQTTPAQPQQDLQSTPQLRNAGAQGQQFQTGTR